MQSGFPTPEVRDFFTGKVWVGAFDRMEVLHFAGWKHHVGIYPVSPMDPDLEADLAPYRAQKDTVKFMYRDPIPYDLIERAGTALGHQHD